MLTGTARPPELDALAARCIVLADDDFAGYSPIYERIARALADDDDVARAARSAPPRSGAPRCWRWPRSTTSCCPSPRARWPRSTPAASAADPWPPFRELLHDRSAEVARAHAHPQHPDQRGRAQRRAAPGPGRRARPRPSPPATTRPLALVELGPSAGLNLLLDRYAVTYRRGGRRRGHHRRPGLPGAAGVRAAGPRPTRSLDRTPRRRSPHGSALDLSPVDVTDPDARRWLSACVWPGVPDRPERLAAAIELARLDPPRLVAGDAVTDLAPLVAALPDDVLPVVVSTWALAYLGRDGRARGARRPRRGRRHARPRPGQRRGAPDHPVGAGAARRPSRPAATPTATAPAPCSGLRTWRGGSGPRRGAGPVPPPRPLDRMGPRHRSDTMSDWVLRRTAARVVLLDRDGHVLLLQAADPADASKGHWWEIPGGGMDPGESSEAAARRELYEETGITEAEIGPCVWTQHARFRFAGWKFDQHEHVHVAWTDHIDLSTIRPGGLEAFEAMAFRGPPLVGPRRPAGQRRRRAPPPPAGVPPRPRRRAAAEHAARHHPHRSRPRLLSPAGRFGTFACCEPAGAPQHGG